MMTIKRRSLYGEKEVDLPSKKARDLLHIASIKEDVLLDEDGQPIAFTCHTEKGDDSDPAAQQKILVDESKLLAALKNNSLEIVWFASYICCKNSHNEAIESDHFPMKETNYFVYFKDGKLASTKFRANLSVID